MFRKQNFPDKGQFSVLTGCGTERDRGIKNNDS